MRFQILLCLMLTATMGLSEDFVTVRTDKGRIKGVEVNSAGRKYFSFRAIKFAQPPTEGLRFQAPVEVAKHEDEFDATGEDIFCPQFDLSSGSAVGDEDCLNLNLHTPGLDDKKRSVVVLLHGGSYIMGAGASYFFIPDYFIDHDVILVTPNYRLGAFGFLATDDKAAEGNMGLLDQIMALKWVQKNIHHFGGDPGKVTLIGDDAGAASATLLAVSPEANGLFHRVMAMSGNALCDHFMQAKPHESAKELANQLGCSTKSGASMVDCLRKKTQQDIVKATNKMFTFFSFPRWFAPVVDGKVIPHHPDTLLSQGRFSKVPFLLGQTQHEGASLYRLTMNSLSLGTYDDNFVDHKLPRLLPIVSSINSKLYPVTRTIRRRYFVNVDLESEDEFRPRYVEFLTDLMYTRCNDRFAQHLANHSTPLYQFVLTHRGQYSIVNLQGESVDMGVAHGDFIQYLFPSTWGEDLPMSPFDTKFSTNTVVPMLINFVKTSDPNWDHTLNWTRRTLDRRSVLMLSDKPRMEDDYKKDVLLFWTNDIPKLMQNKSQKKSRKEEL